MACPGGRPEQPALPFRPDRPRRFRPPVRDPYTPDEVDQEVEKSPEITPPCRAAGAGVLVAVLDSWPMENGSLRPLDRLRALRNRLDRAGIYNPRLDAAVNQGIVRESDIHDLVSDAPFADLPCMRHRCDGTFDSYPMADHGLFVADLLKDVAPAAELSVYRVLNDYGTTDLHTVASAVRVAVARARARQWPLVLNVSLGFAPQMQIIPYLLDSAGGFLRSGDEWVPALKDLGVHARAKSEDERHTTQVNALLEAGLLVKDSNRLTGPVEVLDDLFGFNMEKDGVLVVAAAGNDSCDGRLFPPRLPAVIEGVLGVSAMDKDGSFVWYSNADDLRQPDDGIGAFGGEPGDGSGTATPQPLGLYVSDRIPPDRPGKTGSGGPLNEHGWALWSGTSFATPVAAGLAACIWSEDTSITPQEVLHRLVNERAPGSGSVTERKSIRLRQQDFQ